MPNFIWNREPQEAMDNPYEYEAQDQFDREASAVLNKVSYSLEQFNMRYKVNNKSLEKALWMLYNDSCDSLKDILESLKNKKHRTAGKLLRDVIETVNLAAYFSSNSEQSNKNLNRWYNNEIISNSTYRNYLGKTLGKEAEDEAREHYKIISKFTHRTHNILLYGYVRGKDDLITYDGHRDNEFLVLPHTISMYYAILADFIKMFLSELERTNYLTTQQLEQIWDSSLEKHSVKRRFITPKEVYERAMKNEKNSSQHKGK